jgi:Flp pilus assembly protein TadD
VLFAPEGRRIDPAAEASQRGIEAAGRRDYGAAIADFSEAIRIDPASAESYDSLAWILATCPVGRFRDGAAAVELARKACELTHWSDPEHLSTFAAACAERGDFDEAVRWEGKILEFKLSSDEAAAIRQRLSLYQQHLPYRDQ